MKRAVALLLLIALPAGGAAAQPGAGTAPAPAAPAPAPLDLKSKLINVPGTNWNVYGPGQTNKRLETDGPKGYPAIRVTVTQKGANAWDAGAVAPIAKAIGTGDVLFLVVYLRAPDAKDGETVPLPFVGIGGATAPYPNLVSAPVAINNQWKQYFVSGKAAQALAAGGAQVSVHLAGAPHVIDLGPMLVYDFGPDFNVARLPKNQ